MKLTHEIRDPIHMFIKISSEERKVLDSAPFQRLRYIHQLGLTYLVYPGATHKRFEHSLGVMELASRVFDVVTNPENVYPEIKKFFPELNDNSKLDYWKKVVRMAALCHDLGHIPFSHAAEKDLLPSGWSHETFTVKIIENLEHIWNNMTPPLRTEDIKKIAVGPKELPEVSFSDWEIILSEIITDDSLGVDRIDYLLRDSYHAGVFYGKFDHFRLIDTLRILPKEYAETAEPLLGIEFGGIHTAESLLLARYYMYTQVYMHPIRRIYDIHLQEFMKAWLKEGKIKGDINTHLNLTDNEVLVAMHQAANNNDAPGHNDAKRIIERKHYKVLYSRNPSDVKINLQAGQKIYNYAVEIFGKEQVYYDIYTQSVGNYDFPVIYSNGQIESSLIVSDVLGKIPVVKSEYVFVSPEIKDKAMEWLVENKEDILKNKDDSLLEGEEENEEA